jgi:WD40-like Beta Propeller Repeat
MVRLLLGILLAVLGGVVAGLQGRAGQGPQARARPMPVNLAALNTAADEDDPFVARDGKHLLYSSNASRRFALMISEQNRPLSFFPASEKWPAGKEVEGPDADTDNRSPYLEANNHDLYYAEKIIVKGPGDANQPPANYEIVHSARSSLRGLRQFTEPGFVHAVCTEHDELFPWLSEDGLELYFSRKEADGWHVWVARRPPAPAGKPKGAFGAPQKLRELPPDFCHASLSRDGKSMYMEGPLGNKRWGLFRSTRAGTRQPWGKPVLLEGLSHPDAPTGDHSPCLSWDGFRLYFSSDRPGGKGGRDLWVIETKWFRH